jgi:outer membrane protein assembly factor BamE (lipoprotein component of BamABCDE complex)
MLHRNQLFAALTAAFALCTAATAETIAVDNGIAVKESAVPSPTRGMSMQQVEAKFGAPTNKSGPVGKPPISRWDYAGFIVYFEYDHVIHSVALSS